MKIEEIQTEVNEMIGEIGRFVNSKRSYSTGLIQYPSKRWGIVGSIPAELAIEKENSQGMKYHDSKVFQTKEEGHNELVKLGFSTNDGLNYHKQVA